MSKNDGGSIFPMHDKVVNGPMLDPDGLGMVGHGTIITPGSTGMSLRDYFAAKAMHAELNTAGQCHDAARDLRAAAVKANRTIERQISFNAYALADAMLAERNK